MSHATHANAALTPRARLKMARLIVDGGWAIARAAERYVVSWKTAKKWAERYESDGSALHSLGASDLGAEELEAVTVQLPSARV